MVLKTLDTNEYQMTNDSPCRAQNVNGDVAGHSTTLKIIEPNASVI